MKKTVYLDNHSTTRVDPRVVKEMLPFFSDYFGNAASSSHCFGLQARSAVEVARKQIASFVGAKPHEVFFTSGATESNNIAIIGIAKSLSSRGNHIITSNIEHPAVLDTCEALRKEGFDISLVPVDHSGFVDPADVKKAFCKKTILVSIMHANNEIGVIQNLKEIGRLCREHQILFHSDMAQSAGKIPVDVEDFHVDLASFSAHKMYGPKGVGALYINSHTSVIPVTPLVFGGGQERGLRSGTLNVPGIVGFGKACALASELEERESQTLLELRETLRHGLINRLDGITINGDIAKRLPGNLHVSFMDVDGASLMSELRETVAVSSGSACHSESGNSSHVLRAIGLSEQLANSSIRFGIGRFNTAQDISYTLDYLTDAVSRLRNGFSQQDRIYRSSISAQR